MKSESRVQETLNNLRDAHFILKEKYHSGIKSGLEDFLSTLEWVLDDEKQRIQGDSH